MASWQIQDCYICLRWLFTDSTIAKSPLNHHLADFLFQASNKQIRDVPFKEREKKWGQFVMFFSGLPAALALALAEVPGIAACPAVTCEDACGLSDSSSQYQDPTTSHFHDRVLWNGMDIFKAKG